MHRLPLRRVFPGVAHKRNLNSALRLAYKLRDYQELAVNNVLQATANGIKRPAVVLATGGGKTVVMSHVIPQLKGARPKQTKTLVLAHKEELVRQTADTLRLVNPELSVQIDMAKQKPEADADIVVGSVPTLVRVSRLHQYDPLEYKAIVVDECHHATAKSWTKILKYFGALESDLEILVLGFTATLERTDGASLGDIFEQVVFERNLLTMIDKGELCDVRISSMAVDLSLEKVPTKFGDYDTSVLAEAVNQKNINLQVTRAYLQLRDELALKATLVFCVDINHCRTLCAVLQANGVNAQYVTGETVRHERRAILDDFRSGRIDVLCNVLVFTEGTDIPNIDSMILARPTKSRPLLTQMIGRGLRLHHVKDCCHVIDMVGTTSIGVLSVPTLFGLPEGHNVHKKSLQELQKDKEEYDAAQEAQKLAESEKQVREILQIQKQIKDLMLEFDVVDGFAALLDRNVKLFENPAEVNAAIRDSHIQWVRFEYDVWGAQLPQLNTYYTIERETDYKGAVTFHFNRVERTDMSTIVASDFKCPRIRKICLSSGSLAYVLSDALNLIGRKQRTFAESRLVTDKQVRLLMKGLEAKVALVYAKSYVPQLQRSLAALLMNRASAIIFAMKHSINALWVKWELSRMLGPTPKMQARVERERKRLEKAAEKLQKAAAA